MTKKYWLNYIQVSENLILTTESWLSPGNNYFTDSNFTSYHNLIKTLKCYHCEQKVPIAYTYVDMYTITYSVDIFSLSGTHRSYSSNVIAQYIYTTGVCII